MATIAEVGSLVVEQGDKCFPSNFDDDSGVDNTSESGASSDSDIKAEFSSTESINIDLENTSEELCENCNKSNAKEIKIDSNFPTKNTKEESYIISDGIIPDFEKFDEVTNTDSKESIALDDFGIDWDKMPLYYRTVFKEGTLESFDPYVSFDTKPTWFDEGKFKRGQKFARDFLFCINYSEMLSLYLIFAVKQALQPLIFTDRSHTPFKAFERYLSTLTRVMSWYEGDPWKEGTLSQRNIVTVRTMHRNVQSKLNSTSPAELEQQITLNGRCPMWSTIRSDVLDDFQAACPVPPPGTRPIHRCGVWLNQGDMIATQLAFVGLAVTYPQQLGLHSATEEDLEGFVHLWRTIGYLLGIKDQYNYCNADLPTVRERTHDFINLVAKPSLREVSAEWEHMCRCVVSGVAFYVPGFSFEVSLAYLCDILNIYAPRLNKRLSLWESFKYRVNQLTFGYLLRFPGMVSFYNRLLLNAIDKAKATSPETLKKWEQTEFPYMKQNKNVQSS